MTNPPSRITSDASRIAFIGGGNMARSLIGALARGGGSGSIAVAEPNRDLRQALARDFEVETHDNAAAAAEGAGVLVLAVKPQVMKPVCAEIAAAVAQARPLVVSIAAGIRIAQLSTWLGTSGLAIVRAMPNTPALIGAGAAGLIGNPNVDAEQRAQAERILGAAGSTEWIGREELMDTVTALSGSGPAYFFLLVEALEDAAVSQGMPRETARALAVQTCLGAGRMLAEEGEPPAVLRERVTSPGGTTAAALNAFAAGNLRGLVTDAVAAATARGRELSEQYA